MATLNQVAVLDSNPKNDEARARVGPVTIRHGSYSLLCLSEQNFLRRGAKFIVESRYPFYLHKAKCNMVLYIHIYVLLSELKF